METHHYSDLLTYTVYGRIIIAKNIERFPVHHKARGGGKLVLRGREPDTCTGDTSENFGSHETTETPVAVE